MFGTPLPPPPKKERPPPTHGKDEGNHNAGGTKGAMTNSVFGVMVTSPLLRREYEPPVVVGRAPVVSALSMPYIPAGPRAARWSPGLSWSYVAVVAAAALVLGVARSKPYSPVDPRAARWSLGVSWS